MSDSKKKRSKKGDDGGDEAGGVGGSSKKKAQRGTSNVFSMFNQSQIQLFKEAFRMIDQDKDGFISKNDIRQTFESLGRSCTDKELEQMVSESPGPINFTAFLTIFGDKILGTDEENVILSALSIYNEGDMKCKEDKLKEDMLNFGEAFSQEEYDSAMSEAPMDGSWIDLKKWAKLISGHQSDDEE